MGCGAGDPGTGGDRSLEVDGVTRVVVGTPEKLKPNEGETLNFRFGTWGRCGGPGHTNETGGRNDPHEMRRHDVRKE